MYRCCAQAESFGVLRTEKGLYLLKKSLPARVARQNDVIAAFQGHEARTGNTGRQPAAFLERLHGVMAAVKHERRRLNARKQVCDVDEVHRVTQPHRIVRRGCYALQI